MLKHQSVVHISLIGADDTAMNLVQKHMPSLCDCLFLGTSDPNCLHQKQVKVIGDDFAYLLSLVGKEEGKTVTQHKYDVILVDVPIGTMSWLSLDLYFKLDHVVDFKESILVISSGSRLGLFEIDSENRLSTRETLLHQGAQREVHGSLEFHAIHIYDEVSFEATQIIRLALHACFAYPFHLIFFLALHQPLAQPLASTFMALFYGKGTTYS